MDKFTVAFTGHRPDKLGGYREPNPIRDHLVAKLRARLAELRQAHRGLLAISGMALGFDQWAAEVCVDLRIPFIAAIPFVGQERVWPDERREHYLALLSKATRVHIVSPGGYHRDKMTDRNCWMVDNCDHVIAAWNGSQGGTFHCVHYAMWVGRSRENLMMPSLERP